MERKVLALAAAIGQAAETGRLAAQPQPALRLVRPPRPLPRVGWHSSPAT